MSLNLSFSQSEQLESYAQAMLAGNRPLNFGPRILGLTLDLVLLGVSLHQFSLYLGYTSKDRVYVKATVYWIIAMAIGTSMFTMYDTWWVFVEGFSTYARFLAISKLGWFSLLAICTTIPVQIFYLERAYKLHQRKKWTLFVALPLILCTLVCAICLMVNTQTAKTVADTEKVKPFLYLWNSVNLSIDAMLTGLIFWGLAQATPAWADNDRSVNSLVRLLVETLLPSTVVALGFLLNYSINSGSPVNYFWVLAHSKVYTVSLLAVLNFRMQLCPTNEGSREKNQTFGSGRASTRLTDKIQVDTITYAESHVTPPFKVGLNRQQSESDSDDELKAVSVEGSSDRDSQRSM